ncbi:MAG: hypothetical protein SD837_11745 [Candidatus Electrothrix scaldis]|nr:MAG: hypothetical protein SD837_11745 [Candidatus Electrothrix sp. GW3-3]
MRLYWQYGDTWGVSMLVPGESACWYPASQHGGTCRVSMVTPCSARAMRGFIPAGMMLEGRGDPSSS